MRAFFKIVWLEATSLVRSRTLAMLTVASIAWMYALPRLATGDGTVEGMRELWIHYSLGGVFALVLITLLASSTGSLARERAAKRLALTAVRPVRYSVVALAKICALTAAGAVVLAFSCAALAVEFRQSLSRPCRHVLSAILPSVKAEAEAMYGIYMADPETPQTVRTAKKSTVLRLLESRAADHYFAVRTNETVNWRFERPAVREGLSVRVRFAGPCDSRQNLVGAFRLGDLAGVVSNMTQAVLEVPLVSCAGAGGTAPPAVSGELRLSFSNHGRETVLLRPRRDLELLVPADAFVWNLVRTFVELVALLALSLAFGIFLSASLSRPVALFVAMAVLIVGELSAGILERSEETLDSSLGDRIGYAITRTVSEATRPVTALDPIARLAKDACVEPQEVLRVILIDLLSLPLALSLLAGFVLPRKGDAP